MLLGFDFLVLIALSIWLGTRILFLGIVVFSIGTLFHFQARRTRLLIGEKEGVPSRALKIKAAVFTLCFLAFLAPLALDSGAGIELARKADGSDLLFPVVVMVGLLTATMMSGLGSEEKKR